MLPKLLQAAVISIFLQTTLTSITATATQTTLQTTAVSEPLHSGGASSATTTSLLPLQPPRLNVTSTTIASNLLREATQREQHSGDANNVAVKSDSLLNDSTQQERMRTYNSHSYGYLMGRANDTAFQQPDEGNHEAALAERAAKTKDAYVTFERGQRPLVSYADQQSTSPAELNKTETPKSADSQGYIHFELNPTEQLQQVQPEAPAQQPQKVETVNEVLSNLFPNGFSDIFRFSYASEDVTSPATPAPEPIVPSTSAAVPTVAPSTELPPKSTTKQAYYRYETSVSKEYRREVRPGHTEIVVEKVEILPRASASEEFSDNLIGKEELLRINRAAVEASVLPSLLVEPTQENTKKRELTSPSMNAPIVILNDDSDDLEEHNEEDNLIAESQHVAQPAYQRLPDSANLYPYKDAPIFKPNHEQQINVQIIHDDTLQQARDERPLFTPNAELEAPKETPDARNSRELDHFQEHAERSFHQNNIVHEAPSRKFLKTFNPTIQAESSNAPIKKGNFHYETNTPKPIMQQAPPATPYQQPAAQPHYQEQSSYPRNGLRQAPPPAHKTSDLHTYISDSEPMHTNEHFKLTQYNDPESEADGANSKDLVFVTLNSLQPHSKEYDVKDPPSKRPEEFVVEAVTASSQHHHESAPSTPRPQGSYTYVEVQKSVNIHNKLITEKDGHLVEQHETIYPHPQYGERIPAPKPPAEPPREQQLPVEPPQLQHIPFEPQPPLSHHDYEFVPLSTNPINVQHIDSEVEHQEEAESHPSLQHAPPPVHAPAPAEPQQVAFVERIIPQPYPVNVEKIVDRPYPVTQVVEKEVPYTTKEVVEKIVDRPVRVPYPVQVDHYIDRPYVIQEIVEKHVPVPYPVPEPIAYPVHIDRPYAVETIVEKPMPYPVEKVVEKVVEKHVPVEVERIVEKQAPRLPNDFGKLCKCDSWACKNGGPCGCVMAIDTTTGTCIGIPMPMQFCALTQTAPGSFEIPAKVLQNYYMRMLKKFTPQMTTYRTTTAAPATKPMPSQPSPPPARLPQSTQTRHSTQTPKPTYRITDIRFDLKPPPPPLGSGWSQSARYVYNTLPLDLMVASAEAVPHTEFNMGPPVKESYDEFQRWRNGHSLKRSPQFGRNLHVEYGFKPPLVPSVEIDDQGVPLNSGISKTAE